MKKKLQLGPQASPPAALVKGPMKQQKVSSKQGKQASPPAALVKGPMKQRKGSSKQGKQAGTPAALVKGPMKQQKRSSKQGKQAGTPAVPVEEQRKRTRVIIRKLKRAYPGAKCSLNHSNAFELLIATILSAQCTDERVNIVTADLFRKYRKPDDYLNVPARELEKDIQSTGFFRNKTKSIQGTSKMLNEVYGGEVPHTMDELLELPGVARKTANVVLGNAFDIKAGVVVDTHVTRLSHRLNLSQEKTAEKVEQDLIPIVPKKEWVIFPHLMIYHGRKICKARNPLCDQCEIEKECPSSFLKTGVPPGM